MPRYREDWEREYTDPVSEKEDREREQKLMEEAKRDYEDLIRDLYLSDLDELEDRRLEEDWEDLSFIVYDDPYEDW